MRFSERLADRRRNALSPFSGEFQNRAQERAFREGIWPVWHRRSRTLVLAGSAAFLITALTDYLLLGAGTLFLAILAGRVLVAGYGLSFVLMAARHHSVRFSDYGLLAFLLALTAMFLAMVSVRPDWLRFSGPTCVLILCVFYAMPMTRLWITLTGTLSLTLGMLAMAVWVKDSPAREIGIFTVQLLVTNMIGYFIALRLQRDTRTAWIQQQTLEQRERHQRLLAQLSAQFLVVRSEHIDGALQQGLESLGGHCDCDRAYIMEFDPRHETASMSHEWCADGVPETRATMQQLSSTLMPWASLKMQRGEIVCVDDIDQLPPEASAERSLNQAQGVKSFLCVPLSHEGQLLGMIGLDRVHTQRAWEPDTIAVLRFAGQAMFNALRRARAESCLRERENQFQALTSLSPVGIFHTDADGYCLYVNERWIALSGLPQEAALGNQWRQALHPDDADRVVAAWSRAVQQRAEFDCEYRFRATDGRISWVHARARPQIDPQGRVLGFVGTLDDISERRQVQQSLEQRARVDDFTARLTVQFVQQGAAGVDAAIQKALADIGQFTGADHSRLFLFDWGQQSKSCTHEWCRDGTEQQQPQLQDIPIANSVWACPRILRGEIVNLASLAQLPAEATPEAALYRQLGIQSLLLVPIVSSGHVAGFLALDTATAEQTWSPDIVLLLRVAGEIMLSALQRQQSEETRHQRAQELEKLNLDLEQRNEELQKLAYVASHDLQEPLRAVSSFSSLLARKYQGRLDTEADEYIGHITQAAARLQRLIQDLLAYTRLESQPRSPVDCDLNEIVQVVSANLAETMQSLGATLSCATLPTVHAEPLQMIHLFQHLVGNALRFHGTAPPRIEVRADAAGSEWVLSVADNGIGIAPEHAERVFEIFQRLNPSERYPGNGIGLPVCRRIVERHGGRIWVEPNRPQGCVFRWTLPRRLSATARSAASRHAA